MSRKREVEVTALATKQQESGELAPTQASALTEAEVKAAITVALRFPRDEARAYERLISACRRPGMAEDASYAFPRGGKEISGPTVYLAREAARVWGNIRHGVNVIADDEETRTIEAWAWDLESNTKVTAQDAFKKLIYRKDGGWIKPDERDLRELTNRRAAILKRNCLLELLPPDMIDEARRVAVETVKAAAGADPEAARRRIIDAFAKIAVTEKMLESRLGHSIRQASPDEIADLRQIYKAIADGTATWADYQSAPQHTESADVSVDDIVLVAAEENRGHGKEELGRVSHPEPRDSAPWEAPAEIDPAAAKIVEEAKKRVARLKAGQNKELFE
jgi:hypothetical protein